MDERALSPSQLEKPGPKLESLDGCQGQAGLKRRVSTESASRRVQTIAVESSEGIADYGFSQADAGWRCVL